MIKLFKLRYLIRYLRLLRAARRAGRFSHSPFTKSGMLYLLSSATYVYSPSKIIQLGVGEGVSCIAMFLMAKLRSVADVSIIGYDNFSFRSCGETVSRKVFWNNVKNYKLDANVKLYEQNVLDIQCPYTNVDLLNIDIDNTYDKLLTLYNLGWFACVSENGLIVLEGGFSNHDNLDKSRGINKFCIYLQQNGYQTFTVKRHPGLVFVRKISVMDTEY
jgi:hypothetical protein